MSRWSLNARQASSTASFGYNEYSRKTDLSLGKVAFREGLPDDLLSNIVSRARNIGAEPLIDQLISELTNDGPEVDRIGATSYLHHHGVGVDLPEKQITSVGELVARLEEGIATVKARVHLESLEGRRGLERRDRLRIAAHVKPPEQCAPCEECDECEQCRSFAAARVTVLRADRRS
jgi:hypothetical protein